MRSSRLAPSITALSLLASCGILDSSPEVTVEAYVTSPSHAGTLDVAYTATNVSDRTIWLGACCTLAVLVADGEHADSTWECRPTGPCLAVCPAPPALAPGAAFSGQLQVPAPALGQYRLGVAHSKDQAPQWCWAWSERVPVE